MNSKALLLIGSGKKTRSTSEFLGNFLLERMRELGWRTETLNLGRVFRGQSDPSGLLEAVRQCDTLVVAFPLYVDCLPYAVIRALENIAEDRVGTRIRKKHHLVAIINSGFPEARQSDTAVAVCRKFAAETGFNWSGSLVLPAGEVISGKPLAEAGWVARNAVKSLRLTAIALANHEPVPKAAVERMARPAIPAWIYLLFAKIGWLKMARSHGVQGQLNRRPFV